MQKVTCFFFLMSVYFFVGAQTSTLARIKDPVVLTGNEIAAFHNTNPELIVGFKFENGNWTQIPIQVDEKALTDIVVPYGPIAVAAGYPPAPTNPRLLLYCDTNTYVGADTAIYFDSDDEIVFMLKDAGGVSNGIAPSGVINTSCYEIMITDSYGGIGYVYLFESDGSLQQDAGINYISYSTDVTSTSGFPINLNGTNVENTTISTPSYSWHFSSEWVCDFFAMGTGSNVDILDRYKNFFVNGDCTRHEDAFSAGENAFIAVKHGPVRVIRSYMGAVSGPFTQRTHFYYSERMDIMTDLRVHNINSIYDAFDYNSAANGMLLTSNLDTSGTIIVNGLQDSVVTGELEWEQLTGTPGTISIIHERVTDLVAGEASFGYYYDDDSLNPASNCTGDGQAWGTSGIGIVFANGDVCTDPVYSVCASTQWLRHMQARRLIYIDSANASSALGAHYNDLLDHPLSVSSSACTAVAGYSELNVGKLNLYPNPGAGELNIETENKGKLFVTDIFGKEILSVMISEGTNKIHLKESGIYFLQFTNESGKRSIGKALIQK